MNANETPLKQIPGYQELNISLSAINMIASNIQQLSSAILNNESGEDTPALASSIDMLASLIGWHVDHASTSVGEKPFEGELKNWFMPSYYVKSQANKHESTAE